ncbi:MAG TPA: DUF1707 domain-containing protein [Microlunatus sp.]|nr:DUF1707 domain-containing protein [Microlunatus sp.]
MTDSRPEPLNVGPVAGGNLRASDADRDQVATVLATAYAEGRLTRDEHDERLGRAMSARTFDELIPLTHDLVVVAPPKVTTLSSQAASPYQIDTAHASEDVDNMIAVFGGVTRKGRWRMRKQTRAYALFGGIDLDLREATFEGPVVEITGFWCFGGLDIKVPAGLEVRDQTAGIFGGTDVSNLGERDPRAPVLIVKGMSLFGGVSIKGPKPPKEARRRNR